MARGNCRHMDSGSDIETSSCLHCIRVLDLGRPTLLSQLSEILVTVWRRRKRCDLPNIWLCQLVQTDAGLVHTSLSTPGPWADGGLALSAPRGPRKRMRLDKESLTAEAQKLVRAKRFKSAAWAARAGNLDVSVAGASQLEDEAMMRYLQSSWQEVCHASRVNLSVDESCVGGEPTMLGAICVPSKGLACWCVPQVFTMYDFAV